jgi:osmotically-inducible protein OsmY
MKRLFLGIISIAILALSLACNGNYNGNANANGNYNRAVNANANANANVSPTPRAGTREDYERNRERYQREAKESGRTVGSGANDLWLWVKTRFDLAAADDLRDSTINVDVDNDVVTLTGTVANAAQRARAEAVAKSVEGVKSVRNQLKVSPSGNTNANTK